MKSVFNRGRHARPWWLPQRGSARLLILGATTALAVMMLAVSWAGAAAPGPSGNGVDPIKVDGNPNCDDLGYDFGFKPQPEPPPSGTYTFPGTTHTVTITSDGTYFDWSSTLGVDAVIVKGGPNANTYTYDPESLGDTHLHSPVNPNSINPDNPDGDPYEISHIEFCYDFEVDVSKDANTSLTRTFDWEITKTPDATYDLFTGDTHDHEYTVSVTKDDGTDSDWAVEGTITIENNTPFDATIESVADVITGVGAVIVDCGVTFPHTLLAGDTLECSYSSDLPDDSDRTNTATVTTSGLVGGGTGDADVDFSSATITKVHDEVTVSDTNDDFGEDKTTSVDASWDYESEFACDGDEGEHVNTATVTGDDDEELDDPATATVTINCYELTVTKDAPTSFNRYWNWTIEKSADETSLLLSEGQQFPVNYTVTVDATSTDGDWAVAGDITISNVGNPIPAVVNSVSDVVSPDIAATVECDETLPYEIPAGGTLDCSYSADLPDGSDRTNTATATLQNYDYDKDGVGTASGTTDFDSDDVDVTFSDTPVDEIDECVDVTDTNAVTESNPTGYLGTVCADAVPETFEYSLTFSTEPDADVVLECGDNEHVNTAAFVTNDTGTTDDANWTVDATVACDTGCTLTPGYWKTHSINGPAPYDDTWAQIGEGTSFFLSDKSYYDVLWTAPAGNAYYILAHAYIAAELNMENGASVPAGVQSAFDTATELFNEHTPAEIGSLRGNRAPRPEFIALAGILDAYNNGLTGPGHCSEETA